MYELAAQAFRAKLAYFHPEQLRRLFGTPPKDALARAALSGARDLKTHEAEGAFACSWRDGTTLYVSIRGTVVQDLRNLVDDADCFPAAPCWMPEGALVHGGFLRHYERLRPLLEARVAEAATAGGSEEVRYLGHSLGGATATLAAYHALTTAATPPLRVSLLTFGAPRVGNDVYRAWCARVARGVLVLVTENAPDPVPRAPPWLAEPWWSERRLLQGGILPDLLAHDIDVYIELAEGRRPSLLDYARVLWRWLFSDGCVAELAPAPETWPPPAAQAPSSPSLAHVFPARTKA
jgi:hypothetical protein